MGNSDSKSKGNHNHKVKLGVASVDPFPLQQPQEIPEEPSRADSCCGMGFSLPPPGGENEVRTPEAAERDEKGGASEYATKEDADDGLQIQRELCEENEQEEKAEEQQGQRQEEEEEAERQQQNILSEVACDSSSHADCCTPTLSMSSTLDISHQECKENSRSDPPTKALETAVVVGSASTSNHSESAHSSPAQESTGPVLIVAGEKRLQDEGLTLADLRISHPGCYLLEQGINNSTVVEHRRSSFILQNGKCYKLVISPLPLMRARAMNALVGEEESGEVELCPDQPMEEPKPLQIGIEHFAMDQKTFQRLQRIFQRLVNISPSALVSLLKETGSFITAKQVRID